MEKFGLNQLREMFLSFFETKGHLRLPSFSLIPQNDASLLIINSGMAPMKPYFKGEQEPPRHRVCTCQKCIRTGDIENIGKTARHGTYFEMLGNFSFGDYFKTEAIHWGWEFLTSPEWVGLDPDRLYPSVYVDDDEAFRIWNEEMGISKERIFKFGKEDNFWEHGAGPCGPCSEIYYDRGEKYGCGKPGCTVGCDCDRYMEVWNIVFSQFDNDGNNNYTELKQKNIDTGMGLERLAVVCQDVDSLFDVDTVMNITNKVSELTGAYYEQDHDTDVSLRVITDHIRSAVFMISDGILPSNLGRGYVLRRLIRRAARHGRRLGVKDPFLWKVVETVVEQNEIQYPELRSKVSYIIKVLKAEEESFGKTLDAGMKMCNDLIEEHKAEGIKELSGADAFKLYDTYGFPLDITTDMCEENGMTVDEQGFASYMEEQKQRARKAREALGDLGWAGVEFGKEIQDTEFLGYDNSSCESRVLSIVSDGEKTPMAAAGMDIIVVLDKTVMYAEMGGQVGDHGKIYSDKFILEVNDVKKNKGGKYMHYAKVLSGIVEVGDECTSEYDIERRTAIRRAHSATHILQKALVNACGDHVHQAGSLVEADRLRFDFTHFSALSDDDIRNIEKEVNDVILSALPVHTEVMNVNEAMRSGATALFGEKYGEFVRVLSIGDYSRELCGGTHVDNSSNIGSFHIVSEGSVASGVRRIEAVTGLETLKALNESLLEIAEISAFLKSSPQNILSKLEQMNAELKEQKQLIESLRSKETGAAVDMILKNAVSIGDAHVVTAKLTEGDANSMRKLGDMLRDRDGSVVAVISLAANEKVSILVVCGKDAVAAGYNAGQIIKRICPIIGGKGGGKADSAMGGGTDSGKLDEAMSAVCDCVKCSGGK
ncbi:MAG: alanine--tRNA ligase [Oscillospiraceae bacterium]|nr:alanine--tRNA ligase [Oscillospiraceae bacterium]